MVLLSVFKVQHKKGPKLDLGLPGDIFDPARPHYLTFAHISNLVEKTIFLGFSIFTAQTFIFCVFGNFSFSKYNDGVPLHVATGHTSGVNTFKKKLPRKLKALIFANVFLCDKRIKKRSKDTEKSICILDFFKSRRKKYKN